MEIHEYISDLVALITPTILVDSIVDNGDSTYTLTTANTYYLREAKTVTLDAVDYRVSSVVANTSFILTGSVLPTATSFALYTPYFFHGTPIQIQKELSAIQKGSDKTPVFLLHEIIREQNNSRNFESVIEKEVSVQLFVMDTSKFKDWSTDDHYNVCIAPMRNLLGLFLDELEGNKKLFDTFELDYEVIPRANFGIFTDQQGNLTELYTDYFSGNQLNVTIKVRKQPCTPTITEVSRIVVTDSDGSTYRKLAGLDVTCILCVDNVFTTFNLDAAADLSNVITVDANSAGVYTSISDDGSSGDITIDKNSGGFAAFSNPLTLIATDTIQIKRTITTGTGWVKLTGTY